MPDLQRVRDLRTTSSAYHADPEADRPIRTTRELCFVRFPAVTLAAAEVHWPIARSARRSFAWGGDPLVAVSARQPYKSLPAGRSVDPVREALLVAPPQRPDEEPQER
jgi:hypothetical protein